MIRINFNKSAEEKLRDALNYTGKIIADQTRSNFKATGIKQSISKGIGHKVWRKGWGVYAGLKGNYKLYFFEGGTKSRFTKDNYNRGRIQAYWFLRSAIKSKLLPGISRILNVIRDNDLFTGVTIRVQYRYAL